ncbi:MAG: D-alanyl-D-alanine carboxypeptidase [Oscillospiraceae bacterium]|nr:D-alanyl-D-alanine carboxypeptidase [Oscillospiraceae bacterium]
MKKIRAAAFILIICTIFSLSAPAAAALDEPSVVAHSVVLADMKSDHIIYSKNMNDKVAPASLTKIMTILIAIEAVEAGECSLSDVITAQDDCRIGMESDSSTSDIYPGEQMRLEDLMYCAMLQSANESCNIIGTYLSGSISAFVQRMNDRAAALGCQNTHFANTNGLTDPDHYSTAYDFSLITRAAIGHTLFMTICNTKSHTVPPTNKTTEPRVLDSTNALICADSMYGSGYLYEGAAGVKTGYTRAAGYCLISTATRDDVGIICIVMGSTGVLNSDRDDYGHFVDTIVLYNWAFSNYSYKTVLTTSDGIKKATVDLAAGDGTVILRPQRDVTLLLPKDYDGTTMTVSNIRVNEKDLVAPIASGTVLGSADIYIDGEYYDTVDLVNNLTIEVSRSELLRRQFRNVTSSIWFKLGVILFVIIIASYIFLVVRYRRLRRQQLREQRLAEIRRRKRWEEYQRQSGKTPQEPTHRFSDREMQEYLRAYRSEQNDGDR